MLCAVASRRHRNAAHALASFPALHGGWCKRTQILLKQGALLVLMRTPRQQVVKFSGPQRGPAAGQPLGVFIDCLLPQHGLSPAPQVCVLLCQRAARGSTHLHPAVTPALPADPSHMQHGTVGHPGRAATRRWHCS